MLVGTDVYVRMVFVWEETRVPVGNPSVWLGDHMTISHADARYRVAVVRGACVNTAPSRQQSYNAMGECEMGLSASLVNSTKNPVPFHYSDVNNKT